jgi:hypothetical protein
MDFNPFEHMNEMPFSNIFGGPLFGLPWQDTVMFPNGQTAPSAIPGQPDTVAYWLPDATGTYHQITHDQEFAQLLWLHAAYGAPLPGSASSPDLAKIGFALPDYHLSDAALEAAVLSMPDLLAKVAATGVTEQQVLAYAHAEAPDVMIVGQL